jgi:hypothetical protein
MQDFMNLKNALTLSLILVVSACSAPEFRGSVIAFGDATETAAQAQTARLAALSDQQLAQIRGSLARERVLLDYSPACALLGQPGADITQCEVIRRDGEPIGTPERFSSLEALNAAMADYGRALSTLAANADNDAAAFTKSLTDLAASVDGLGAALDSGAASASDRTDRLNAIATGGGSIGGALFAGSRVSKLRDIISQVDPDIQQATRLLSQAAEALSFSEITAGLQKATATRDALRRTVANGGSQQSIARLQSQLFTDIENLKRLSHVKDTYAAIGQSHAALARASGSGASLDELKASILELARLAKDVSSTSDAF